MTWPASIGDYLEAGWVTAGWTYAADGAIALNLLDENSYDIIILDLMLPKIDGIRVCERRCREPR